jgi:hypothetical protein
VPFVTALSVHVNAVTGVGKPQTFALLVPERVT